MPILVARPLIVFDVSETLLNLQPWSRPFERIFGDKRDMRLRFLDFRFRARLGLLELSCRYGSPIPHGFFRSPGPNPAQVELQLGFGRPDLLLLSEPMDQQKRF